MIRNININELSEYIARGATFLDVRESYEVPKFDLPNHINIPVGEILDRLDEIPREQEVLVYCYMGGRSGAVVSALVEKYGFDNLINIEGGSIAMSTILPSID